MTKIQIKQRPLLTRPEQFQGVPPFIAEILARRGVQSEQELELKLKNLLAPQLKGLETAVALIDQAIDEQKNCYCWRLRCRWSNQYSVNGIGASRYGSTSRLFGSRPI